MSKHNYWAVERKKLGRDVKRQKPTAVDNANKNVGKMVRCRIGTLCLAMSNKSYMASVSKPGEKRTTKINFMTILKASLIKKRKLLDEISKKFARNE